MNLRSAERERPSLSSQLHDALLALVMMEPSDERARRVVLFLAGDGYSVRSVHGWRRGKSRRILLGILP